MTLEERKNVVEDEDFLLEMLDHPIKWTPQDIAYKIHTEYGIEGQEEAVKCAAQILYNHLEGRYSVSLFTGPSGVGKTEIWRAISKEMGPENVVFLDGSVCVAEGWHGGVKLSEVFRSLGANRPGIINKPNAIIIIDEFDKLVRPKLGRGNTNYSAIMQDNLLRMCDHDVLVFSGGETGRTFSVDTSELTIVLLGAFEEIRRNKIQSAEYRTIGFTQEAKEENEHASDPTVISREDLINYGMARELVGRVGKMVAMENLSLKSVKDIGFRFIKDLEEKVHNRIHIDDATMTILAQKAVDQGLGARFLKTCIQELVDQCIWEDPYRMYEYHIKLSPANEKQYY